MTFCIFVKVTNVPGRNAAKFRDAGTLQILRERRQFLDVLPVVFGASPRCIFTNSKYGVRIGANHAGVTGGEPTRRRNFPRSSVSRKILTEARRTRERLALFPGAFDHVLVGQCRRDRGGAGDRRPIPRDVQGLSAAPARALKPCQQLTCAGRRP